MITTIILLSICLIVLGFVTMNLYNQVNQLEQYLEHAGKVEEDVDKYYQYFLGLFTKCYVELQRIDKRGSFSSDDEVGFSFRVVLTAIGDVKTKLESMKLQQEKEQFEELKQKYGKDQEK